jgi:nucleoside-diphosphate-sugar epimerase
MLASEVLNLYDPVSMKLPAERVAQLRTFYEGRTVCVTGGAGFIGGHLCDALISLGASIRVLDDLSNSTLEHLAGLIELEPDRARFIHGSILDDEALREAVDGCRTIFHLAAVGSVQRSMEQPQRTWSVNATGTVRVLEAARASKGRIERVVFAASSSVYGDAPTLPRQEDQAPKPKSPYAASKLAGEQLLSVWAHCYNLSTVSLRYFNVFGPRQVADSAYAAVVAAFASRLLNNEPPVIYGDGSTTRDFTPVSSAVLATLLAGASKQPLAGDVINIGTGRRTTIADLAALMARLTGHTTLEPKNLPGRAGDVPHSLADITRARQLLSYEPIGSLEDGLTETLDWYKLGVAKT